MIKTKILFTCGFFFSSLYKRFFIAFFLLETEQARQAGAGSDVGSRPGVTKPHGRRSPGVPVGTWSRWAHRMGARQGSGAETMRGKARHGEGEAARAPRGVGAKSTPRHWGGNTHGEGWHVVGAEWHVGDEVTRWSTMQDTLSPGEGCKSPKHPALPPGQALGKDGSFQTQDPRHSEPSPSCQPPGPNMSPRWTSQPLALPQLLSVARREK